MPELRDDQLPTGAGSAGEVEVVPAASVLVVRGEPTEVLMMRRTSRSTFVPGAWIFPGGTIDPIDLENSAAVGGDEQTTMQFCAARELIEEVGIRLDGSTVSDEDRGRLFADPSASPQLRPRVEDLDRLVLTSRWVTPDGVPKRFDTWFFLLEVEPHVEAKHDEIEGVDHLWITPTEALERHQSRELDMVFPTIKNLEAIAGYRSVPDLFESRRGVDVRVTRPELVVRGGRKRIILPEEEE